MLEVNESNFNEETQKGVVLVDFFANWCGPCRALAPTLEQVSNVKVVKVDIDESPNIASRFKISSIPTLIFFKDGIEVERKVGVHSLVQLQECVDRLNVEASFS